MNTIQNLSLNLVEYGIIYIMLLISMIPVIAISRTTDTPERILYAWVEEERKWIRHYSADDVANNRAPDWYLNSVGIAT